MEIPEQCSQEIENSSNSTKNSKKVLDISELFIKKWEKLNNPVSRTISNVTIPSLPVLDKTNYIENWICSNNGEASDTGSEISCPDSPQFSGRNSELSRQKRISASPLSSHRWKRSRRDYLEAKENSRYGTISPILRSSFGPLRNVENNISNNEKKSGNRVVCRFSWYKKSESKSSKSGKLTQELSEESVNVVNQKSSEPSSNHSRLEKTPSRWSVYESDRSFRRKRTNADRDVPGFDRGKVSFQSRSPLGPRKRFSRNLSTARSPSLPIVRGDGSSSSKYQIFNRKSFLGNSTPNIPSSTQKLEDESPLRWTGYCPNIDDHCEIPETLALSSPIKETEPTIRSSSPSDPFADLIVDAQSPQKSVKSLQEEDLKIEVVTPPRWSRHKSSGSSRLQVLAPSPLSEVFLSQLSPRSIRNIYSGSDNPVSSTNSGSKQKKRPVNLETLFNSNDVRSECSESTNVPDTRPVSSTNSETAEINVEAPINRFSEKNPEIEMEVESQSDITISDLIENIFTQNASLSASKESFVEQKLDYDPDETYCSQGEIVPDAPEMKTSAERPQEIFENTTSDLALKRNNSSFISQGSSESRINEERSIFVANANPFRNVNKKTKKAKKGSLVSKLQTLVSRRISNLQVWRYQMSRAEMKNNRVQFVKLSIKERETRYGRHFLLATILDDPHDLLKDLFVLDERKSTSTLTLMIIPEINGTTKISNESILNIYQPWDIMSIEERIISVTYFDIEIRKKNRNVVRERSENIRVLQRFECPCLKQGTIDGTCSVKFTTTKPSVMQALLDL